MIYLSKHGKSETYNWNLMIFFGTICQRMVGVLHFGGDLDYVGDFLVSCFL